MTTTQKQCLNCNTSFEAVNSEINRGYGKYCSRHCSAKHTGQIYSQKVTQPNEKCAYCQKPIYRRQWQRNQSKSGLFFCTPNHKDLAQRLNSNIDLTLPHYGNGNRANYRNYIFTDKTQTHDQCNRCNTTFPIPVIRIHHIDRDRLNNDISNLEKLCPNCHEMHHFNTKTSYYSYC